MLDPTQNNVRIVRFRRTIFRRETLFRTDRDSAIAQ